MSHTFGPWITQYDPESGCNGYWIESKDGEGDVAWLSEDTGTEKCKVLANARLIAAAPDLLEACEWILGRLTYNEPGEQSCEEAPYHKIWKAIAKAKGE